MGDAKTVTPMTNAEVASLAAEIGNLCTDFARQWSELDSAREGLPDEERAHEDAENERIEDGHSAQLRAIFDRYVAAPRETRGEPDWKRFAEHLSWCAACAQDGLTGENTMTQYRKKPVVIDAVQYTGKNLREIMDFAASSAREFEEDFAGTAISITTLEGVMTASLNDWIIKGIKGEFYPCKDEIFRLTYEPVGVVVVSPALLMESQTPMAPERGDVPESEAGMCVRTSGC